MGQEDSPRRSPGATGAGPVEESDEGYLSRLQPYVHKGTRSGAIAAAVGAGTFLRALGSLVRRNWGRAIARLTVAAAWLTVAVLQRRSAREQPAVPDRADVEAPVVPRTEEETGAESGETTIEIDEPGTESGTADEPIDEIGTGGVEADPVDPASDDLDVDVDEQELDVDESEEGESEATDDGETTLGEDESEDDEAG